MTLFVPKQQMHLSGLCDIKEFEMVQAHRYTFSCSSSMEAHMELGLENHHQTIPLCHWPVNINLVLFNDTTMFEGCFEDVVDTFLVVWSPLVDL